MPAFAQMGQLAVQGTTGALSPPADLWDGQCAIFPGQRWLEGADPVRPPATPSARQNARRTARAPFMGANSGTRLLCFQRFR
jgi:hypothetical protein